MHITQNEKRLNIYSADCYNSYCGTKCVKLIYGSALKEVNLFCIVYYVLTASVASICGRDQLLKNSGSHSDVFKDKKQGLHQSNTSYLF